MCTFFCFAYITLGEVMYYTYKNIHLYYEKFGSGKKEMIILPGWGHNRKTFDNTIDEFKSKYSIYIVDYPGFGNSPFPNKDLTIFDYTDMIVSFIKYLNLTNPVIIAHSFGGRIALVMNGCYKFPISKMILIGSAGIKPKKTICSLYRKYRYKFLKRLGCFLPKKKRLKYFSKLLNKYASSDYLRLSDRQRKTFINIVNQDLTFCLEKIKASTLLIWGEEDLSTPIKDGIKMNKLIKDSGLVTINKASHFCYLEQPKYVSLVIREFLKNKTKNN